MNGAKSTAVKCFIVYRCINIPALQGFRQILIVLDKDSQKFGLRGLTHNLMAITWLEVDGRSLTNLQGSF